MFYIHGQKANYDPMIIFTLTFFRRYETDVIVSNFKLKLKYILVNLNIVLYKLKFIIILGYVLKNSAINQVNNKINIKKVLKRIIRNNFYSTQFLCLRHATAYTNLSHFLKSMLYYILFK